MELNQDCVRSILLELEEKLTLNDHVYLNDLKQLTTFREYEEDTCIYAILKLIEAGYLNGKPVRGDGRIIDLGISSMTWEGHLFLDNIRDNKIWSKTKESVKGLSSISISLLSSVAGDILKKQIGL